MIVGRKDDEHDLATKLLDGLVPVDHKHSSRPSGLTDEGLPTIKPVMLVVARNTNEADQVAEIIRRDDFRGVGRADAVVVVHS